LSDAVGTVGEAEWLVLLPGVVVAFISGIWAIKMVLAFVKRGRFHLFAIYCFVVGGLGLWLL